jgi:hypothetical protein
MKALDGIYYLRRLGNDAQHPVMEVGEVWAMLVYSSSERARRAADDLGGAEVLYEVNPQLLFSGLPEGASKLLLDYEPETGEGWLLSPEDL